MRPLKDYRPNIPEAFERIIARCLEKNREERYPSCRQLRADLERFILSAGEPVGAEELAALVAQLLPPTQQGSEQVEAPSSSSRSPAPLALPRPALSPQPKPRLQVVPLPPPKEVLAEPETGDLPPPDRLDGAPLRTDRSVISPADRREVSGSAPKAVPARPIERSAQELLLDASWEAGLAPTARLAKRGRLRGGVLLSATLLVGLVAAVGGAIVLGWMPPVLQRVFPFPPVLAPPVTEPAPPQAPVLAPEPEAPAARPPPVVEPEPSTEPLEAQGSEAPAPGEPTELPKPVAVAKRAKQKGGKGSLEQKIREAAVEEDPATPAVTGGAAPQEPPEARPPSMEQSQLAAAVFESSPPAQIRVNGHFVGLSPVTLRNLVPGPVQVEVYDSVKGFSKRKTFLLEPGDNGVMQVRVEQATLELRIHPGAVVFLDGNRLGQTPLAPVRLYEGKHGLRLLNEEMQKEVITTLSLGPGEVLVFEYNLENDKQ
jgi:serine/threonine-protein kinase